MVSAVLVHGTGSIGSRHMRVLDRGLGVRTLALPARGPRAATADETCTIVDSYAAAAAQGATAIVIATTTGRHLDDARDALRAGFHVLVEKPLAASTAGLAALERAARDVGRHVFVGCCLRFLLPLQHFREQLPEIGAIHHVEIACQSYLPEWRPGTDYRASYSARADEGGVLRDLIHEIDYAAWLFGWPTEVSARLGNTGRLGIAAEEWAELSWQASRATAVSIRLDYLTRPARRMMRAHGEHGTLELDLIEHSVTLMRAGEAGIIASMPQERDSMMEQQARAFIAAVSGGDPGPLATLEDGARALAICDAAREAAQTRMPAPVHDWRTA